ncbi:MAG: hypothetical protein GW939_03395 [Candidatus Magasanikbacteria bacterium]|uniref:DUF8128 domain-containing protein n=1 Tax=Candidatus Magasanikbacteria bacterium CG10_big_fil_rev_8_21_14_0_10_38_6 TaxID=1974647 RepID=A0A2M6P227_9BACT|nr:hypothetical protein [Candidatus Magasanikbacteria bacterium]NCS71666.1 hypothetical protein [Candidatus Magasanikbacteria bacterium]PIR77747.1 MAG: hypothetical protein COU30_00770 [Candidatus Magasanikbacteria bacterium CG10_big_fil_rev_8_21_14_0_10_38_6]
MLDLGFVQINTDQIVKGFNAFLFDQTIYQIAWDIFVLGGWLLLFWILLNFALDFYVDYRSGKYTADWKFVVLAIDVPQLNVQTPKAVEQLFTQLAGALESPDVGEKFRGGYVPREFSFEIISIEGYIQFIIRTEEKFRDLVEAAMYAQYPEAEISEVEDYIDSVPDKYPNTTHDMWGADFILAENDAYPIRSYTEFEHNISKDTVLKDPMGTFLESFSRIGAGEQMWFQIVIRPTDNKWKEKAIDAIKEFIGDKSLKKKKPSIFSSLTSGGIMGELKGLADEAQTQILGAVLGVGGAAAAAAEGEPPNNLKSMTPGQVKLVEEMEKKIGKIGFKTKLRAIYVARKEVFKPERGVHAMIGAINQFNIPNANSIVPGYGPGASYFMKDKRTAQRKMLIMNAYKKRKLKGPKNPYVLNIEELATIWHFPMSHVRTPLLQKAGAKQSEPPSNLPVELIAGISYSSREEPIDPQAPVQPIDSGYIVDSQGGFNSDQEFG